MTIRRRVLLWFVACLVVLVAAAALILRGPAFGAASAAQGLARYTNSPQFVDGRFENAPPQASLDLAKLRTMIGNYLGGQVREPRFAIPVRALGAADFTSAAPDLRLYWFGHASVLIELDGMRLMTDPIFSERASPFTSLGPRRFHPPPLPLARMPRLDAVLISHDHYAHLDLRSVQHFAAQGTNFYVGLGIGAHLERWGVPLAQIHELDWWESATLQSLTIHCTPARHYSGRRTADNSTLWSSWFVRGPGRAVYYSGDTGYTTHFADIRARLGAPDVAIIKIGAYGETWLDIHMDPEAAVRAHADLGAATLLPVHWATFNLAYHDWAEPIERTLAAAAIHGIKVATPRVGEAFDFGQPLPATRWWRQPPSPLPLSREGRGEGERGQGRGAERGTQRLSR